MDSTALELYLGDARLRGAPLAGGFDGAAGGAPCGDLIRISIAIEGGRIAAVSHGADGCAVARAAAAATCALVDDASMLEAALIGPDRVAEELGGLSATSTRSRPPEAGAGASASAGRRWLR